MPSNPLPIVTAQQIANAATTYYTSTAIKTRIDALTVCNPTTSAATVTIYVVPNGGSTNDSTTIIKDLSIPAKYTWPGTGVVGLMLDAGGLLRAVASAATTLTLAASGTQIS